MRMYGILVCFFPSLLSLLQHSLFQYIRNWISHCVPSLSVFQPRGTYSFTAWPSYVLLSPLSCIKRQIWEVPWGSFSIPRRRMMPWFFFLSSQQLSGLKLTTSLSSQRAKTKKFAGKSNSENVLRAANRPLKKAKKKRSSVEKTILRKGKGGNP